MYYAIVINSLLTTSTVPDFRSSTGLFTSLRQEHNLKGSGKDLFDASVYKDASSTSSFHDMVRNMSKLTKNARPTKFHHMLATLAQDDRLLRLYTQNIDGIDTGLEPLATTVPLKKEKGKWPKSVQLHGGLDKMVCSKCGDLSDFDADLFDGPLAPVCATCVELDRVRTDIAGKRSHGIGRLRPRMVLYNEHNPDDEAIGAVTQDDMKKRPDAIIVVGTSMKIPGVKRIVREMCNIVRDRKDGVAIWINNDPEPTGKEFEDCWDIVVRGTCDEVAKHAALRYWWEKDDSEEPTQEQWNKAIANSVEVVINKTYKAVPTTEHFRKALPSPTFSPIAPRTVLEIKNSFSEEEEITIATPPTPSKSPKKVTAFDELKKKGANQTGTKAKQNRPSNVKYIKKATSKAAAGKAKTPAGANKAATKPQAKINQTFKQTKATTAAEKSLKVKSEGAAMQPLPSKDSRINVSPTKTTSMFPGLTEYKSPKKASDKRMSIESILV